MKKVLTNYWMKLLFALLGGVAGYLYWHHIGCSTGNCPITSHWESSTGYGIILGWLISNSIPKTKTVINENQCIK